MAVRSGRDDRYGSHKWHLPVLFQRTQRKSSRPVLTSAYLPFPLLDWLLRRNRDLLVIELQHTQEQLRAEMARTEELATTRERARIARDIHDVLAHTLTI